ncbi:glycosyltransferase [bacterium]|nr:glycosyltransferase [bacterium]
MCCNLPTTEYLRGVLNGKRIIFVLEMLEMGGAERQALMLARYLKEEIGANVHVVGFNSPGAGARLCEELGIEWSIIPISIQTGRRKRYIAPFVFAFRLRKLKPDVLLSYTVSPNVLCGIAWRWTGAKSCVWNQRDEGTERADRILEWCSVRNTPCFIANSQGGADFLTKVLGAEDRRVSVVHNGIQLPDPLITQTGWREKLGISPSAFTACMVANFRWPKDHATLIRAWRQVIDHISACVDESPVLLFAGRFDGTAETAKALTRELGLDGAVRFLGPVGDISGLLGAVNLGILCSESEGMPNSVLESMSVGLPFVGSDVQGIRDAVGPAGCEYLVTSRDADGLSKMICRFIESPELCAEQGEINAKRIKDEFLPEHMCNRATQIISDSLVAGGNK